MEAENITSGNTLLRFLIELALGQWNARLAVTAGGASAIEGDQFARPESESLLAALLGEELRSLVLHKAFVNPHKKYGFVQNGLFLLDGDFLIRGLTSGAALFLGCSEVSLYRNDFVALLDKTSQQEFNKAVSVLDEKTDSPGELLVLRFKSNRGVALQADCFLTPVHYGKQRFAVNLFGLKPLHLFSNKLKEKDRPKQHDTVQKVYDLILAHRDGPFPTTQALARQFGTNEFELKRDFKKRMGTSIYQCYIQERLKRAYVLVIGSDLALLEVARQSGFDDYSTFARAFRKQFGSNPAIIRETGK
ncbi:helix-turn-helix transcriptional regulator [Flavobacterium psychrotrophum]|uniref:helix-turn-helix transcriptional regulator n=1 Tax=Flavobacterium psychrotrophum TaxID=2294119 RepID=UPI000E30D8B4|nr:AraC family transcriptional regulator [Flavobacterium psychrotrophum]